MSVNLNDLNKYNEATMYNSVNVQPTKIDNVETPATSEDVSNDKKSETKLDKRAVSVAQKSQKNKNEHIPKKIYIKKGANLAPF